MGPVLRALASAILFLTRIPLPELKLEPRDFARGAAWFSWVGGLVALPAWAATLLLPWLGVRLTALLALALWVLITGGLHLDGLADSVDGLSGGRGDRTRTLDIMRDSRIGSHGALALALLLMLKWAALERVLELGRPAWLIAPVVGRFAATVLLVCFPYARSSGLGAPFVGELGVVTLLIGAAPVALGVALLGPLSGWAVGAALLVALLVGLRMHRLLGGLTGDVYGAAVELSELAALLALSVWH